ncbi:UNVERIFIED_CONTAM: F-box/LRR-repeat protein [Sesamum radiatum]|uniref:F-box/LRR-repeat protein n=1 Tax=Sesamum radiatum TaxID=300843 RepID=A0AAW2IST7_SESRA
MIMADEEGTRIGVLIFNDDVNIFAGRFQLHKTYFISNGEVKKVNPMFPNAHPEKELILKRYRPIVISLWEDMAKNEGLQLQQIAHQNPIIAIAKVTAKKFQRNNDPAKIRERAMIQRMIDAKETTLKEIINNRDSLSQFTKVAKESAAKNAMKMTYKRHQGARDADRLSTLPQHILIEILSRLSTIEAAKVSFGSRIWMTTWRLLPNLIFDYSQFPDVVNKAHSFLRFIDWTVSHHDESDVKIFELQLGPTTYCEVLMKYQRVEFAIQHNVQKLVLHGRVCGTQNLADSIFSCRSLVKLELYVNDLVFFWPETIHLPNLKKLKLKFLLLPEMITNQDLFSNFAALEKLSMFFCSVAYFDVLSISSSR